MIGVSFPARILPDILADRYTGPINLLIPVALVSSIMLFSRMGVTGLGGLYVFEVFYGVF
jgi:hypothetical protein